MGKTGRQNGGGRYGEPADRLDVVIGPMHALTLLAWKPGDLLATRAPRDAGRTGKAKAVRQ